MTDLIELIEHRIALVDSISAALAERRARRPAGQQRYQSRCQREHRARMEGLRTLKGEKA